ncbi:uncharacterized protein LOC123498225 [Portunus trituberculatus]|uniref:uncharacterized protein LOC123498225 n=1 Tax=Portunus trituberculatus TaxID=210409 RepID=UPI001E1CBCE4|nr:uncharacterized protein LOC123498225 [Portunus trituberculatus]
MCCMRWQPRITSVTTISGDTFRCTGVGEVSVETPAGLCARLEALVVSQPPLGADVVLGIAGIEALGGVTVKSASDVQFCGAGQRRLCGTAGPAPLVVDAPDFSVQFNTVSRTWIVTWKWTNGAAPDCLGNTVEQYNVPLSMRQAFCQELESWITSGWLVPHDEQQHGAPRGLLPLMVVRQNNGGKVRPVLDYRELNDCVTAFTADSDVCSDQLRKWRRHGENVSVLDLRKAYLQVRVDQQLWPFQTVMVRGWRYCLTRLGFGLNIAPQVMKAVVKTILAQDSKIEQAVLPYVDDLLVNEDLVSAEQVAAHFASYGLECKQPVRVADGARLLGLRVRPVNGELQWTRDNAVAAPPKQVTRRAVFAWCGRLIAHLPVGGWLRPAVAWIKRQVNASTRGWDDVTGDDALCEQMEYVSSRLSKEDPCCGQWCVHGDQAVVWTDASSIAAGVVVETPQGAAIEDACWIRRDESSHINMAELDAAVRGVNLAIAWGMRTIDLRTDSATVYRWIDDALSGRARLRTKAHGEMLIRRRIDVIRQLVTELELVMSVTLVRSSENRADALTRVPGEWVRGDKDGSAVSVAAVAAASAASSRYSSVASVADVHIRAGHPGVRRTFFFARRDISRAVTRAEARATVRQCEVCRKIDPAPAKWQHGSLSVTETWWRLATDVTHYLGSAYLSLVDCGPSRFAAWRHLRRPHADTVVSHLEQVFCERGAPAELLCDNDTVFRGRRFAAFAARWGVSLRFRGAYAPSGNGIVERNHRTVKVIAARKGCSVAEAVHLYNVTPRDGETVASAPVSGIYRYRVRDCVRHDQVQRAVQNYTVDDTVWVRRRGERCTSASQPGVVTRVNSPQVVEVDGVPRHVRDLRHRSSLSVNEAGTPDEPGVEDEPPLHVDAQSQLLQPQVAEPPPEAPREAVLRRSTRERHPP